jgi:hypothetical protein
MSCGEGVARAGLTRRGGWNVGVRKDQRVIRSARYALALPAVLLVLAGCGADQGGAMIACETFVNQRVGVEVHHLTPNDGETVQGDGPFTVRGGFTEPVTRRLTHYTCTVSKTPQDTWHLDELTTDR